MKFNAWLVPLFLVGAVVVFFSGARLKRLVHLSDLPTWSVDTPQSNDASPTGHAHGWRQALVLDPTSQSQQWIAQTQTALHDGKLFMHHVAYDNAPYGRRSSYSPLYRLWLVVTSYVVSLCGAANGIAVEIAALFCDPLFHLLAAGVSGWYAWKRLGRVASVLVTVQVLSLFPFATLFLPGLPHAQGMAEFFGLWQVLLVISGALGAPFDARRRLFLAGACGGIGLSLNLTSHFSLMLGIGIGAAAEILLAQKCSKEEALPWRSWGLGGCVVSLVVFGLDQFSALGEWRLEALHPFYSVVWWLLGETLQSLVSWKSGQLLTPRQRFQAVVLGVALLTALALPLVYTHALLAADINVNRLTRLTGGFTVGNTWDWWKQDSASLRFWATLGPAGFTVLLMSRALRHETRGLQRRVLFILSSAMAMTLLLAAGHLRWWATFNVLTISLTGVLSAQRTLRDVPLLLVSTGTAVILGLLTLVPSRQVFHPEEFDVTEMRALMERDLAQWISQRRPEAVVLAPPELTASLWYYGGLRGITTFDPENREGFMGGLRIAAATTAQEAQVLLRQRGVTHIVLPSWDSGLVEAARDVSDNKKSQFLEQLGDWILPGWTRPVSYFMPPIDGFDRQAVVTLEIDDDSPDVALLSSMATYFIETGMPDHASQLRTFLRRFPNQLDALIALAEIEHFKGDRDAFENAVHAIELSLAAGGDRSLSWERRLALVVTFVKAGKTEEAAARARKLFASVDEQDLRKLSARSLYRVLALKKALGMTFLTPASEALARSLLPPDLRHELP